MSLFLTRLLTALLLTGGLLNPCLGRADELPPEDSALREGIQAYREGQYAVAEKHLAQLHANKPEQSIATYYLAMTEAQLGRFEQARKLYEEVLLVDPNSRAALLAKEGLKYLPTHTGGALDLPPRFEAPAEAVTPSAATPAQPPATQPTATGMSPQDLMMMQMMMSPMNGSGGNNNMMMNPMMFGMMGQQPSQDGQQGIDPNVFSTMLMNSMMQNFNMSGDKDNN